MMQTDYLRVSLTNVRKLAAGYEFRIVGHADDLDEARRRLEHAIPPYARMISRTGTWCVRREYKSIVERLFPSFEQRAAVVDNQVPLF